MTDCKKLNNVTVLAGAKCDHPPHRNLSAAGANAFAKMPTDYDEQAKLTQQLVTAAQNGDKAALERLYIFYEPLFRKEMRREIFYNYNGADFSHFAGYVRCRIHFALYDEMKKAWERENNEAALPVSDEAGVHLPADNPIDREELAILLKLALKKLTEKQRNTIKALYFEGYSGKEIAAKEKITPAMVSKNHKQALKILRGNIA